MGYLDLSQLKSLGLAAFGEDVLISDRASIYNAAAIKLGSHIRIDDFCILSAGLGGIVLGDHIHIAAYTSLIGAGRITLNDFSDMSSRVSIYSSSDDYSGATMTNPTISEKYKNLHVEDVVIGRHVIVGCGSVVLPGATLGECAPFGIYVGAPARRVRERSRDLLAVEARFLTDRAAARLSR
jgi:galactoside O-acetyltransferase